jgi:hypothetical protein
LSDDLYLHGQEFAEGVFWELSTGPTASGVKHMNWLSIFTTSGITTVLLGAFVFCMKTKLNASIAHGYQKALEEYKGSLQWESRRREQATQIAELISLWVAGNYDKRLDKNLARYQIQKKYWELALWLEPCVLRALNKAFTGDQFTTLRYKEALIAVRKAIVGATDDIQPLELVHWNPVDASAEQESK